MNYTLQRIDPRSAARVAAVVAAVVSFIYVVVALVVVMVTNIQLDVSEQPFGAVSIWFLLLAPVGYLIGIYLMTLVICLLFNAVSGYFGGIRIELSGD